VQFKFHEVEKTTMDSSVCVCVCVCFHRSMALIFKQLGVAYSYAKRKKILFLNHHNYSTLPNVSFPFCTLYTHSYNIIGGGADIGDGRKGFIKNVILDWISVTGDHFKKSTKPPTCHSHVSAGKIRKERKKKKKKNLKKGAGGREKILKPTIKI